MIITSPFFTQTIIGENSSAIPDKKQIIAHLRIWVNATYRNTADHQLADQYLKICIKKISDKKVLRGSHRSILDHYKNKIVHALERDQVLGKIASLRFQHTVMEKGCKLSEICRESAERQAYQKKNEELESKRKFLRWQNILLKKIHPVPFPAPTPLSQRSLIETIIDITQVEAENKARELEKKALALHINDDQSLEGNKREKIDRLQRKLDQCFKETVTLESQLQIFRGESLKKIKKLNEEIALCIENLKSEPQRLNTLFDPLDRDYSEENQAEWKRTSTEIDLMHKSIQEKLEKQRSDYEQDFAQQNRDDDQQKRTIAKRYQDLSSAHEHRYANELGAINDQSARKVILNKTHFNRKNDRALAQTRRELTENSHMDSQLREREEAHMKNRSRMHQEIRKEFSNIKSRYSQQSIQMRSMLLTHINGQITLLNEENALKYRPEKNQVHQELKRILKNLLEGENDSPVV